MSDEKIREVLHIHLNEMPTPLPTVWQNRAPPNGFDASKAHQKAFLLRGANQSYGLQEKTTIRVGFLQVNLCYPAGIGTSEIEARAVAIQEHFKGRELTLDGVKVRIRGLPSIADPISVNPYVVPVSIRYQSIT